MYYYLDNDDCFIESTIEPEYEDVSEMLLIVDEIPRREWEEGKILYKDFIERNGRGTVRGATVMSDIDLHKLEQAEDSVGNILRIVDFLTSRPNVTKCNISIEDMEGDKEVRCDISWEK